MKNSSVKNALNYSTICSKVKNRHIGLIDHEKIIYCEAAGSYTWIYLKNDENIKASCQLNIVEEQLLSVVFIRCHKSFIVNTNFIVDFSDKKPYTLTLCNGAIVPIAAHIRTELMEQVFINI